MRINNLPDGCNRLDEPWSRDHINGPDYEEIFDLTGPITKEEFTFFFEDEIEKQQRFDEFIEDYFDNSIKSQGGETMEMIVQRRHF